MKAYVMNRHGGPDALEWREDFPDPEPGPGEVVIEVGAAGLNNTDIWTREGAYGSDGDADSTQGWTEGGIAFPRIQGGDVAGQIIALGSGVPRQRLGDRVLVNPTFYNEEFELVAFLGSELDGGFAELCKVPADHAVKVESDLSDVELASFPVAYQTAEGMLRRAQVCAGDRLLVTGASGGLGSALVQLGGLRGAEVIAIAGVEKVEGVKALGAAAVIPRGTEKLGQAIKDALSGRNTDRGGRCGRREGLPHPDRCFDAQRALCGGRGHGGSGGAVGSTPTLPQALDFLRLHFGGCGRLRQPCQPHRKPCTQTLGRGQLSLERTFTGTGTFS